MSRHQVYCKECYNSNREVKGGEDKMLTQTQKEYNNNIKEKDKMKETTIKEIKTVRDLERKKSWKTTKEELVNNIINYGKSIQGNLTNTQLRSVFSGAYFKYNSEECK